MAKIVQPVDSSGFFIKLTKNLLIQYFTREQIAAASSVGGAPRPISGQVWPRGK